MHISRVSIEPRLLKELILLYFTGQLHQLDNDKQYFLLGSAYDSIAIYSLTLVNSEADNHETFSG